MPTLFYVDRKDVDAPPGHVGCSRLSSCGAVTWFHTKLLVCSACLSFLFRFTFSFFSFVLEVCVL
jgi:hypothetical protein